MSDSTIDTKEKRKKLFNEICEAVKTFKIVFKKAVMRFYEIDIN